MELRLYSFVNYYLSSMQAGIQTGHAAVDMLMKYRCYSGTRSSNTEMVEDWAERYKTFIVLNGGNNESLYQTAAVAARSGLPFVIFREDEQSLGGILTTVAMVLPENIFNAKRNDPAHPESFYFEVPKDREVEFLGVDAYFPPEHKHNELITLLRSSRLA